MTDSTKLIERLRDRARQFFGHVDGRGAASEEMKQAAALIEQQAADIAENDALIDELRDRIAALESAAKAEPVAYGWEDPLCGAVALMAKAGTEGWKRIPLYRHTIVPQSLSAEQRKAIEWAAGRAHVEALGKPVDGVEGRRWRTLNDLFQSAEKSAAPAATDNGGGRDAWISVDERLPDEDSVVLVSAWEYGKPGGKRFVLVARRSGSLFLNEETGDDLYTPTHWQPLPAPPAALSKKAGEKDD